MRTKALLRFFWLGFAIHFGLTLSFLINLHLEPTKNIHLTTQRDGVLLYGSNNLGLTSIRIFKNWNDMETYLKNYHLSLPKLSFAEQGSDISATLLRSKESKYATYYRIFWTPQSAVASPANLVGFMNSPVQQRERLAQPEHKMVLHTPDPESALEMLKFVKYFKLSPSEMGYSIPVYRENEFSI